MSSFPVWIAKKIIDQLSNRILTATYRDLPLKFPKSVTVPRFCIVDHNITSIADAVNENLVGLKRDTVFNTVLNTLHEYATGEELSLILRKPLIVHDKTTWNIYGKEVLTDFQNHRYKRADHFEVNGNSIDEVLNLVNFASAGIFSKLEVSPLEHELQGLNEQQRYLKEKYGQVRCGRKRFNVIYGVGGGSVIDVAQYAAKLLNIHFISVPTSLTNDGFASQFCVLNLDTDGTQTLEANVPLGIIVNLSKIIANDPYYHRRISAGIGDLLSNITACQDWQISPDKVDPIIKHISLFGAESVMKYIHENGSLDACAKDYTFLERLAVALIQSGEAMSRYGSSRPGSGFEHKLYHSFNQVTDYKSKTMHGELVAIGTLISAYAHDQNYEELKSAFEKVGLPTTLKQLKTVINIPDLELAIATANNIKPDRYTILEEKGPEYLLECFHKVYQ
ncbi:MAG: iron-containing alcohol dehydrogenase [Nanoarchaeota archaeon]|nr:iron-containing alcohol dehydrogenase [Nanoarchaeota archaeon]